MHAPFDTYLLPSAVPLNLMRRIETEPATRAMLYKNTKQLTRAFRGAN